MSSTISKNKATTQVTVLIPNPLREYTDGKKEVTVSGDSVKKVFEVLDQRYPGIEDQIYNEENQLRDYLNIFIDDEDIRFKDGLETSLEEGTEISIIPAIAGGSTKYTMPDVSNRTR